MKYSICIYIYIYIYIISEFNKLQYFAGSGIRTAGFREVGFTFELANRPTNSGPISPCYVYVY